MRARVTRENFQPPHLFVTHVSSRHQRSAHGQKYIRADLRAFLFAFTQKLLDLVTPERDVFVETEDERVDHVLQIRATQLRRGWVRSFRHDRVIVVADDAEVDGSARRKQVRQNEKAAFLFAELIGFLFTFTRWVLYFHSLRRSRQRPRMKVSQQRADHFSSWTTQSIA